MMFHSFVNVYQRVLMDGVLVFLKPIHARKSEETDCSCRFFADSIGISAGCLFCTSPLELNSLREQKMYGQDQHDMVDPKNLVRFSWDTLW